MQGAKSNAARLIGSSSRHLRNCSGIHFHRQNDPAILTAHSNPFANSAGSHRTASNLSSSSCHVVEMSVKDEGGELESSYAANMKVHDRVADEIVGASGEEKKNWWVPHPETGIFVPEGDLKDVSAWPYRLSKATVDENEKFWVRTPEDLEKFV